MVIFNSYFDNQRVAIPDWDKPLMLVCVQRADHDEMESVME